MQPVSQIMRIAQGLDEGLRSGATKLAGAVDQLPFMHDAPETLGRHAHGRAAVQSAYDQASAGLAELQGTAAFQRADFYGEVKQGVANLGRALDDTPATSEFVDPSWNHLIHGAADDFDNIVRELGSPGWY